MEHPFVADLSNKTLEELQTSMSSITTKLTFAYRTGNQPLINQLYMVLESYKNQYNKKLDEQIAKQNIQSKIKIEKDK